MSTSRLVTSEEKRCLCCLLHPIKSDLRLSSLAPSPTPILIVDLVRMGVVSHPHISFQTNCASPKDYNLNKKWKDWVSIMAKEERFTSTWRRAGIHDAIVAASTYADINIDQQAIEAVFGFWCPVTNTFVFPWGEAGFTLEDSHVLTGLPLRGSELDRELTTEEEDLQMELIVELERIVELHDEARLTKVITNGIWIEWFMNRDDIDDQLRHTAFLTYWLCKDVFPSQSVGPIEDAALGLATRLSSGEKISLAPTLVANMYRTLNSMTKYHLSVDEKRAQKAREGKLKGCTSFGILQCWIWERFESLRPPVQGTIPQQAGTRIIRWSGKKTETDYSKVMEILQDERQFSWRPYSRRLSKWIEPEWYSMDTQTIALGSARTPAYAYDFLEVVSSSYVKGLSESGFIFSERYQPHRVARQFGFDQAVPAEIDSWRPSNHHFLLTDKLKISIPRITRCGNLRTEYITWWKLYQTSYAETMLKVEKETISDKRGRKRKKKDIDRVPLGSNDDPTIKAKFGSKDQLILDPAQTTRATSSVGFAYPLYSCRKLAIKKISACGIKVYDPDAPDASKIDIEEEKNNQSNQIINANRREEKKNRRMRRKRKKSELS